MSFFQAVIAFVIISWLINDFKADIKKELRDEMSDKKPEAPVAPRKLTEEEKQEVAEQMLTTYKMFEAEAKGHELAAAIAKQQENAAYKDFKSDKAKEARARWLKEKKQAEDLREMAQRFL